MRSVVDRKVVMRRVTVVAYLTSGIFVYMRDLVSDGGLAGALVV